MQQELVGVRECARQIGLNPSTISRQVAAGIIPNHGSEDAPRVSVAEARAARQENLDLTRRRIPRARLRDDAAADKDAAAGQDAAEDAADDDLPDAPAAGETRRGPSFSATRTAREGYQAKLLQLDYEQRIGNLLDKSEVYDAFFALGTLLRDALETRRQRLASRFADIAPGLAAALAEDDAKVIAAVSEQFARALQGDDNGDDDAA
jgi:hypothetical protein